MISRQFQRTGTGAKCQFGDLRRKAADELNADTRLDKAQALLGHINLSINEHYALGKTQKGTLLPRKSFPQKKVEVKPSEGKGHV